MSLPPLTTVRVRLVVFETLVDPHEKHMGEAPTFNCAMDASMMLTLKDCIAFRFLTSSVTLVMPCFVLSHFRTFIHIRMVVLRTRGVTMHDCHCQDM